MSQESRKPSFDPTRSLTSLIRIPVYVEDREAALYFENLLPELATVGEFKVAGGVYGVTSRITTDRQNHPDGLSFGIRDRDYSPRAEHMLGIEHPTYVFERFEIENYCLDWRAISDYARERMRQTVTADDIERFARGYANDIVYAVAYNGIVAELDSLLTRKLPVAVKIYAKPYASLDSVERGKTVMNCDGIVSRLLSSELCAWIGSGCAEAAMDEDELRRKVETTVSRYVESLAVGSQQWRDLFPGKEILRAICLRLFGDSARMTSLVGYVAAFQRSNKVIPEEFQRLSERLHAVLTRKSEKSHRH